MAPTGQSDPPPGIILSSSQAAGPRIMLEPGGTLQARLILSDEALFSIKGVLQQAKSRILPGVEVTDQEFTNFLDLIYADNWEPGRFCKGGDAKMTRRSARDCAYTFGTLRETLHASPKRAGRSRPRSFSERNLHRETAPRATQLWRQAGAPVRMLVEHRMEGAVTFSLRDQKLAIIHGDAKVNYNGNGAEDAYFHAMRRNDEFMASNVHKYNIEQAIYICRNRLTHWSNPGVLPGLLPPSERLNDALSEVKLCRNINDIQACPAAAKDRLRATPAPELFPDV